MLRRCRAHALALSLGGLFACDEPAPVKGPPPLPVVRPAEPARDHASSAEPRRAKGRDEPATKRTAGATKERAKATSGKPAEADRPRPAKEPSPPAGAAKESTARAPLPATAATKSAPAKPKTRVVVPHTDHVHADISDALQADLDADPRMQAWLTKVMSIIDACHAKDRNAVGTVQGTLTMHESARPTFALGSISPQLGGVVTCATGQLLRIKMPLFTGREGARHTVRVNFE